MTWTIVPSNTIHGLLAVVDETDGMLVADGLTKDAADLLVAAEPHMGELLDHVAAMAEAIDAIRSRHTRNEASTGQTWCLHCGADWPCPTVATLDLATGRLS